MRKLETKYGAFFFNEIQNGSQRREMQRQSWSGRKTSKIPTLKVSGYGTVGTFIFFLIVTSVKIIMVKKLFTVLYLYYLLFFMYIMGLSDHANGKESLCQ